MKLILLIILLTAPTFSRFYWDELWEKHEPMKSANGSQP